MCGNLQYHPVQDMIDTTFLNETTMIRAQKQQETSSSEGAQVPVWL